MPNRIYALEWLELAEHNLSGAHILFNADHFTDVIACEIQQALEKTLKALLGYGNIKIPKSHNLVEIYALQNLLRLEEDELSLLDSATLCYVEDRYPNPRYFMPSREEISQLLDFAGGLLSRVKMIVN
jgi:HEPN domain-containing protein